MQTEWPRLNAAIFGNPRQKSVIARWISRRVIGTSTASNRAPRPVQIKIAS